MFKKRLKGLLAATIAATALPLTASAYMNPEYTITVIGGGLSGTLSVDDDIEWNSLGGCLAIDENDPDKTAEKLYQTDNNLWRIYGEQFSGQTKFQTAVSGDKLAPTLKGYIEDMFGDYLNLTINPEHHYTVTTKNPYTSTEDDPILTDTELTFTAFPDNESGEPVLTLSLPEEFTTDVDDPMKIVSWTLYGANNDGENYSNYNNITGAVSVPVGSRCFEIPMETFKGIYPFENRDYSAPYFNDIRFPDSAVIYVESEDRNFNLPVKSALLKQETESDGDNRHILVRKDCDVLLDEEDDSFYLCYLDKEKKFFKISSSEMKTEKAVWDEIAEWAAEIENLNISNLFLCRNVIATVIGNGTYYSQFNTKDLFDYQFINQGKYTTNEALIALYTAKAKSIWKVDPYGDDIPSFYTYQADAIESISDFLLEYPHERVLSLIEQGSINVTALDPNTNEEIDDNSYIETGSWRWRKKLRRSGRSLRDWRYKCTAT